MCEWNLKSHQNWERICSSSIHTSIVWVQNVNSVRVYLWVLEVSLLTALPPRALVPPVFLGPHLVSSSNMGSSWRWCTRCLRSVAWEKFSSLSSGFWGVVFLGHRLGPKSSGETKRGQTGFDGFFCWRCLCFGWFFGAVHYGVIDWLPLMDMKSQNRSTWDVLKRENRPTCQPQLVSLPDFWTTNSIERCHVFICWRGES